MPRIPRSPAQPEARSHPSVNHSTTSPVPVIPRPDVAARLAASRRPPPDLRFQRTGIGGRCDAGVGAGGGGPAGGRDGRSGSADLVAGRRSRVVEAGPDLRACEHEDGSRTRRLAIQKAPTAVCSPPQTASSKPGLHPRPHTHNPISFPPLKSPRPRPSHRPLTHYLPCRARFPPRSQTQRV